ncbi:GntR family transcriptional regulator [Sporolactobacillus kofuensis]|uniref:GntR family transcriptional regulator n=1 Tax=Sporolactobacillus kofuensis TaxID=269672 RepID=A0ABW1WEI7_9BACL|nr:GntR family transcriptional regulator [Sporolactobacillus kofuensis]MCO7176265.1 GntR family transcriptional regulator [Sporolactobacillus kofuensis]
MLQSLLMNKPCHLQNSTRNDEMFDRQSPVPMYYQIEQYIEQLIENKNLQAGDQIPSERELTDHFHVSRMTVRQAIMELVNAGILVRIKGKGTFVANHYKIEKNLLGLDGFSEDMIRRGMTPGSQILDFSRTLPSSNVSKHLGLKTSEEVFEIKRVRLANDEPIGIEISYLPVRVFPELTEKKADPSLYQYIEKECGLKIHHAEQSLEASLVTNEEAEILKIPNGSPLLLIERCSFLESGQPIEQTLSLFRADRYKFTITLPRG